MKSSRRSFLKIAGVTAIGLGTKPALDVLAASGGHAGPEPAFEKNAKALTAKQWGMVIDTTKFESASDLEPVIEACHKAHNVPDFLNEDMPGYDDWNKRHVINWIWDEEFKHAFTDHAANNYINERVKHLPFLVLCNHCEEPACVRVCPTKATFKNDQGIVLMDFHRCIGCRFCMAACPFGARSFNWRDPRDAFKDEEGKIKLPNPVFPTRMKGVVEKCNFCAERLAVGKQPACVEASKGAIVVGDLYDPESEIRKILDSNFTIRRKQSLGTQPAVYYIV